MSTLEVANMLKISKWCQFGVDLHKIQPAFLYELMSQFRRAKNSFFHRSNQVPAKIDTFILSGIDQK